MADLGHQLTDKELAALENRIKQVYSKASKELQKKVDEYFAKFVERDKHQKELLEAGKITEQQYMQWRLAQIGRGKRFEALRDDVSERMTKANQVSAAYINDTTPGIYSLNHNYAAYTIEQVAGDVGFTIYDEQTVRRMIEDDPTLLPKRRVNAPKDLKWNRQQFTAEITSGILLGEPIGTIANRVRNLSDANRAGAIRNARTAVTGAQNAGRQESYYRAKEMGLNLRKRWIATKDNRTRHAHAMLDGQTVPLDKPFEIEGQELMFPGDPTGLPRLVWNCRCTMRTVEKEGIEAEPRQMRVRDPETGRNVLVNEMTYPEWEDWKRSQNPGKFEADRKKIKYKASDKKQYENYYSVLKEKAGKKFEDFQETKYNNTERWEFIKLDYARRSKLIAHPELALPNAEKASAAEAKFTKYLFDPENKKGWAKGQAFIGRLGYSAENWEALQKEVLRGAKLYTANHKGNNGYGEVYEQRMVLYGKNDLPANVIVGWIGKEDGTMNMTTLYIKEVK